MSRVLALCYLPSEKKQKHAFHIFRLIHHKTSSIIGFRDIQNNQGPGKGYQPKLDCSGYHKNFIQKMFRIWRIRNSKKVLNYIVFGSFLNNFVVELVFTSYIVYTVHVL